jgi:2-C-methyl-D-erythritol 4-phosphate cytidylyltransferase
MNIAIVLAGGTGNRVGGNTPKQFIEVFGKPILAYTLEIFQNDPEIDAIEIVSHKDWIDETKSICSNYKITKTKWFCVGGSSFQESTKNGVFNLKDKISRDDIVVITFGVSPMTPISDINDSISVCKLHGNGIAATDIDLCTCLKDDSVSSTHGVLRETLKGFANPWSFKFGELCDAYEEIIKLGKFESLEPHTTSLYFALGKRIWFSKSTTPQVKITRKSDIDTFEGFLLLKKEKGAIQQLEKRT